MNKLIIVASFVVVVLAAGCAGVSVRPIARGEYGFSLTPIPATETFYSPALKGNGDPHPRKQGTVTAGDEIRDFTAQYGQAMAGARFQAGPAQLDLMAGPSVYWTEAREASVGVLLKPRFRYELGKDFFVTGEANLVLHENDSENITCFFGIEKVW